MSDPPPQPDGSDLCIGCGMCCDGTYHLRGRLRPDREAQPLSFYKNENFEEEGQSFFRMPCAHFNGTCCSIYESRYVACRGYRCKLLARFEDGKVSFDEAKEVVAKAKSLIAQVAAADPQARLSGERNRIRTELARDLAQPGEAERAGKSARLLNIVALDEFIDRWFENNDSGQPGPHE